MNVDRQRRVDSEAARGSLRIIAERSRQDKQTRSNIASELKQIEKEEAQLEQVLIDQDFKRKPSALSIQYGNIDELSQSLESGEMTPEDTCALALNLLGELVTMKLQIERMETALNELVSKGFWSENKGNQHGN